MIYPDPPTSEHGQYYPIIWDPDQQKWVAWEGQVKLTGTIAVEVLTDTYISIEPGQSYNVIIPWHNSPYKRVKFTGRDINHSNLRCTWVNYRSTSTLSAFTQTGIQKNVTLTADSSGGFETEYLSPAGVYGVLTLENTHADNINWVRSLSIIKEV